MYLFKKDQKCNLDHINGKHKPFNDNKKKVNHTILLSIIKFKINIMQGEDDLRGLAKIMGFMRAVSIILVLTHFYWFCYAFFLEQGWGVEIINKILSNFQKTAGLFSHPFIQKLLLSFFLH